MSYYKFVAKLSHFSFRFIKKVYTTVFNFIDAVMTGFWLGIMGGKSIDFSDELAYNSIKFYRDEKYNQSGLFEWEKPLIQKYFSDTKSILLIAAGGGREAFALNKMGYKVDSYESNPNLVESGNILFEKNNINSRINYLPRNSVPGEVKKYDAVIVGWGAYSFMWGRKIRLSFLSGLYPFLDNESPLMISFVSAGKRTWKDKIIRNVSNFFRFFGRREKTEMGDRLTPSFNHFFTEEEIRDELQISKFRVLEYQGGANAYVIAKPGFKGLKV